MDQGEQQPGDQLMSDNSRRHQWRGSQSQGDPRSVNQKPPLGLTRVPNVPSTSLPDHGPGK